jgi:hypothetical protein
VGFPFAFQHRYGKLTILEFSSKCVKVMLLNREGGRDGGSLVTNSAGSVTTQSIAFKYTMASEPYMNAWQVCHTVRLTFFQNAFSIEINMFLNLTEIFLN